MTVPAAAFQDPLSRATTPGGQGASIQETIDALIALNVKVVGLGTAASPFFPASSFPRQELEAVATLTGAVDSAGNPLYFEIDPANSMDLAQSIIDGVIGTIGAAQPGDWGSVTLEQYSHDRNAESLIEIESPGDMTREKIPFYTRIGVREMLILGSDTKSVELLTLEAGALKPAPVRSAILDLTFERLEVEEKLSIRVSGTLYTFGCLTLPALVAKNLAREIRPLLWLAPGIALLAAVAGFVLAHALDVPPAHATVALL